MLECFSSKHLRVLITNKGVLRRAVLLRRGTDKLGADTERQAAQRLLFVLVAEHESREHGLPLIEAKSFWCLLAKTGNRALGNLVGKIA